MTDSIGVAVIGAGMAGRSHAHAYRTAQTVFGSHAPPVANGAAGTVSISRVAYGHPNSLGFEIFGTKAAASFDLSANAEFGYVDNAPDRVTNGWRRVIVGPDHPYIAAAQSMPFPASATEDKSSLPTRRVPSWMRLPDSTDCLARPPGRRVAKYAG